MAGVKNLRYRFLLLFMLILLSNQSQHLQASPWAIPGDLIIRHDIQLLVDSGVISIPITTWPLSWGDIAYNLSKTEKEMTSLELASFQRIKEALLEEEIGGLSGSSVFRFSKNPDPVSLFEDSVGGNSEIEFESSYLSNNIAINLHANKTGGETLLDESYIAFALGDYSLSLGSKKTWWGPGWGSSLILSTATRPIPGLSIERNFSDPFESKLLNWIGPWRLSLMVGELEHSRTRSDTLFFGMRIGMRPLNNLEIGLSRSSLFCGKDRPCGLSEFGKMFFGQNSGYQMAGFDFRSSHQIKSIPFALYGQIIGESLRDSIGLFGFETWGPIEQYSQLESYRIFIEATSTSCGFYSNDNSRYGCAYQDPLYPDGYRYEGFNIGHSADGDSQLLTIGGMIVATNSKLFKSSMSLGKLNRGSSSQYQLIQNNSDFFKFNLGYEFDLFWFDIPLGNLDVGLGLDVLRNIAKDITIKDPRIQLSWHNSIDFSPKKVRDYSEYLALIEVTADDGKGEEITIDTEIEVIDFVIIGEKNLSELIVMIDQVTLERQPILEYTNKDGSNKSSDAFLNQSMEKKSNFDMTLTGVEYDLTEIMLKLDKTIDKRN